MTKQIYDINHILDDDTKEWIKKHKESLLHSSLIPFSYQGFLVELKDSNAHIQLAKKSTYPEILWKLYKDWNVFNLSNQYLPTPLLDDITTKEDVWVKMITKEEMVKHPNVSDKVLLELAEYTIIPKVAKIAKMRWTYRKYCLDNQSELSWFLTSNFCNCDEVENDRK
jgi:hypothetical protein